MMILIDVAVLAMEHVGAGGFRSTALIEPLLNIVCNTLSIFVVLFGG